MLVSDPELVRDVLIRDFNAFRSRVGSSLLYVADGGGWVGDVICWGNSPELSWHPHSLSGNECIEAPVTA